MSGKLKLTASAGGSVKFKVDDALLTDEEVNIPLAGFVSADGSQAISGEQEFNVMPTIASDYIIEEGSAGNGHWVKYAGGLLIQYGTVTHDMNSTSFTHHPYPIAFVGAKGIVSGSLALGDSVWYENAHNLVIMSNSTTQWTSLNRIPADATYELYYQAIGRWK